MGYDLHITRAADWKANAGWHIAAAEWLAFVERDPELTLDPSNGPYAAIWRGRSPRVTGWFDWYEGNVFTTNPDKPTVKKMLAIAHELSSMVQGDSGEVYEDEHEYEERE